MWTAAVSDTGKAFGVLHAIELCCAVCKHLSLPHCKTAGCTCMAILEYDAGRSSMQSMQSYPVQTQKVGKGNTDIDNDRLSCVQRSIMCQPLQVE